MESGIKLPFTKKPCFVVKELLAHYGVKSELENYNGAMSKSNWVRKLLVVLYQVRLSVN